MANALSYDKWNVIDGVSSDDDESKGAARPLLAGGKSHAQHQADEAMYEAFKQRFKEHFKGRAPLRQRKLLARFVAMQHRYAEPSNTFRYADIIGIVTQRRNRFLRQRPGHPSNHIQRTTHPLILHWPFSRLYRAKRYAMDGRCC